MVLSNAAESQQRLSLKSHEGNRGCLLCSILDHRGQPLTVE